jgi:glycosyltransferase involved in cell wall biosynthesis
LMKEFIGGNQRVKYFRLEKNMGNAYARNIAFSNSLGRYIAFMDDDDFWCDEKKLEKQISLLENSAPNVGLIFTKVRVLSDGGEESVPDIQVPKDLRLHMLKRNGIIYSPTVMVKRQLLEITGGFDEKMPRGVDSEFYRSCFFRSQFEAVLLPDITTVIDESGKDRMTLQGDRLNKIKVVRANLRILRMYFRHFLIEPSALMFRSRVIIKALLGMIRI